MRSISSKTNMSIDQLPAKGVKAISSLFEKITSPKQLNVRRRTQSVTPKSEISNNNNNSNTSNLFPNAFEREISNAIISNLPSNCVIYQSAQNYYSFNNNNNNINDEKSLDCNSNSNINNISDNKYEIVYKIEISNNDNSIDKQKTNNETDNNIPPGSSQVSFLSDEMNEDLTHLIHFVPNEQLINEPTNNSENNDNNNTSHRIYFTTNDIKKICIDGIKHFEANMKFQEAIKELQKENERLKEIISKQQKQIKKSKSKSQTNMNINIPQLTPLNDSNENDNKNDYFMSPNGVSVDTIKSATSASVSINIPNRRRSNAYDYSISPPSTNLKNNNNNNNNIMNGNGNGNNNGNITTKSSYCDTKTKNVNSNRRRKHRKNSKKESANIVLSKRDRYGIDGIDDILIGILPMSLNDFDKMIENYESDNPYINAKKMQQLKNEKDKKRFLKLRKFSNSKNNSNKNSVSKYNRARTTDHLNLNNNNNNGDDIINIPKSKTPIMSDIHSVDNNNGTNNKKNKKKHRSHQRTNTLEPRNLLKKTNEMNYNNNNSFNNNNNNDGDAYFENYKYMKEEHGSSSSCSSNSDEFEENEFAEELRKDMIIIQDKIEYFSKKIIKFENIKNEFSKIKQNQHANLYENFIEYWETNNNNSDDDDSNDNNEFEITETETKQEKEAKKQIYQFLYNIIINCYNLMNEYKTFYDNATDIKDKFDWLDKMLDISKTIENSSTNTYGSSVRNSNEYKWNAIGQNIITNIKAKAINSLSNYPTNELFINLQFFKDEERSKLLIEYIAHCCQLSSYVVLWNVLYKYKTKKIIKHRRNDNKMNDIGEPNFDLKLNPSFEQAFMTNNNEAYNAKYYKLDNNFGNTNGENSIITYFTFPGLYKFYEMKGSTKNPWIVKPYVIL